MELMTYKTRALRTLSLLILVALIAALNPPSLTDSTAFAQATAPELTSSADTANQVDLSWTDVEDADDYELWRWEDAEGWVELDDSISGTSHTDSGVTAGKTYYYQVSADGGTTWSNRVNETVGAYDASTLDAPTATSTAVSLSWSAVTGAASYELWRYENSWTQVGGALTTTTYADASVEIGKTYFYQVMAKGPNGDGAWSNRVSAVVPSTTPGAPLNFSATPGDAQVTLSWDAPASNGGSAITGYQYRYQMSGGSWSSWMATTPALARTATVTSLTNESNYNFEVQAVNANGADATATASAMPMSTVPDTPMSFGSTSTGPTEIALSWDAVTGAVSYQLKRRTNGGAWGAPMDAGSGTTYTDMDLTPSTTYDYEVRSVNAAGSSPWSAVVTASTTGPEAPDAVSDLSATASADKITLMWTMPDSNGAAITGYDLDVSDDGSDWDDLSAPAAADTSAEHENLDPGTMKYYRIRAMNSEGYSDWSASAMATVAAVAPGKPTLYTAVSGTTVMLTWVAPAATGGADITRYTIQVSTTGTGGWGALATKAGDDTSHDHTDLKPGNTRYYRINAASSAGTGDWSDIASATIAGAAPPLDRETPDATSPVGLSAAGDPLAADAEAGTSTTSITLTWRAPTLLSSETRTVTGYEIQQWDDATQVWADVDRTDTAALTETVMGLNGVTKYYFRVRSVLSDNSKGIWAERISATTVAVSPSKPALTATKMGTDKIVLTWSVPDDGGSDIIGYVLEVAADQASFSEYLNAAGEAGSAAVLLEAAQESVTHTMDSSAAALTAGSTWRYRISAVNGVVATDDPPVSNAAWSAMSDVAMATTDTGVPGIPTIALDATTTPGTVGITLTNDDTGGSDFTTHEIQVYDAAKDRWTILQDNALLTFPHTGLDANVMMHYRARSKNARGAGDWGTASVKTAPGAPGKPVLTATVNGPDSITLSWTAPNNGGTPITAYTIEVGTTDPDSGETAWAEADADTHQGLDPAEVTADSRTATHTGLNAGDKRSYRVTATNDTPGMPSNVVTATTTTGGKPAAPAWATTDPLVATGNTVAVDWEAVPDPVTGYDIAIWENGEWKIAAGKVAKDPTDYVVSGLSGATTYYFSVRARNGDVTGPFSMVQEIMTAEGAPGKPVLTATPDGATKIVLTWTAPDDGGLAIMSYLVQVSNNGTSGWEPLQETPGDGDYSNTEEITGIGIATNVDLPDDSDEPAPPLTVTHDEGITGMTRKFYRVLAANGDITDAAFRGMWSDVKDTTTPAGKPAMVMLSVQPTTELADKFVISWAAPSTGGSAITGYQIQVWDDGEWMDLMSVGGSVTTYTHEPIPGATTRHYRVRAMNAVGYGPWSATQERTTVAGKPGAPELHASGNGTTQIRLTWTAPATGEAADSAGGITGYQIQVSDDGQSGWTAPETSTTIVAGERVHQTAGTVRNYADTGLDPASTKHYRVRAMNAQGTGPWSNVAMAMTDGGTPGRPKLTATKSGTSMINLAWTPPEGDGGSAITGYELQYWDGSNGWMDLTSTTASVTLHTHRNIAGGMTKYYRIRAMNSGGSGLWSTVAYATTDTSVPGPPTLMAMADGATKIKLTWTAGHDGGEPITAFHLQHSSDRGTTWDALGDARSNMMMMSTEDTDLSGGTTKHYRIRAVNGKGTSGWSPLASATTGISVPSRPVLTAVGLGGGRIELLWTVKDGGSRIIRHELQRWDTSNRRWMALTSTSNMRYTDTGRDANMKSFYRVRAVNGEGDGPWSTFTGSTSTVSN